ncbi:hypothetical protein SprV_0902729100 [Sparganum proliferum]
MSTICCLAPALVISLGGASIFAAGFYIVSLGREPGERIAYNYITGSAVICCGATLVFMSAILWLRICRNLQQLKRPLYIRQCED